jgi:FKBP-type peptidyl-prolyl cis-trans isomerase
MDFKIPSASGERQILPKQTIKTFMFKDLVAYFYCLYIFVKIIEVLKQVRIIFFFLVLLQNLSQIKAQVPTDGHFIPLRNGTVYKIHTYLPGTHPQWNDIVVIQLNKYNGEGKLLFSTTHFDSGNGVEMDLKPTRVPGDITEAFLEMTSGDSATVYVPEWVADIDSSLKDNGRFYRYEIKLIAFTSRATHEVMKKNKLMNLKTKELAAFETYVREHGKKHKIIRDSSGVVIIKAKKTPKGDAVKSGDKIKVHYKCIIFPHIKEVDNSYARNESFEFTVGKGEVIKGWDIALPYLKKGGKAKLLIPSWCGYGERGAGNDIMPDTPLLFEIEILP